MGLLLRLGCYLAVIAAVAGGAAGALLLLEPQPGQTAGVATEAPRAPMPNRITAWQERKAEEQAYAARAANPPPQAVALSAPSVEVPAVREAPVEESPVVSTARTHPKPQRTAKRPRQRDNDMALGYAAAPRPRIAYENLFNAMRDRAGN